ncbi:MAG TPA: JDVT-CTERM system glutamic-type intramembrane protease [Nitrospira sp.]|nr:JDVT-CTERM system glutamic-type intramembrane protease [Nitrospira sp.]
MKLDLRARELSSEQISHTDLIVEASGVSPHERFMLRLSAHVTALLGLHNHRPFHRDPVFLSLFVCGPFVWCAMTEGFQFQPLSQHVLWSVAFLSIALWQPLLEELLFRGIIQGHMLQPLTRWKPWIGLSMPNLLTSLFFSLAHLAGHSITWSLLVFVPSLCFGFVRDRFGSVYPSIILHAFYNVGHFLFVDGVMLFNSR